MKNTKSVGWPCIVVGTVSFLVMLMAMRFGAVGPAIGWSMLIISGFILIIGAFFLDVFRRGISGDTTSKSISRDQVQLDLQGVIKTVTELSDDSNEASNTITNVLRPAYLALVRQLADNLGLLGEIHVQVQMALGDLTNAMERVWTTLADNAPQAAREAWQEACRHARRLQEILPKN